MKNLTILCMGDSHIAGDPGYDPLMGGNPESSYQFWLKEGLHLKLPEHALRIINEGICGDTSGGIVARLIHALTPVPCDLVILAGGTNDLGMWGEETVIRNLTRGYDGCRDRGIHLIAPSIPPISLEGYGAPVKKINRAIEDDASACSSVFFADWFNAFSHAGSDLRRARLRLRHSEGYGDHGAGTGGFPGRGGPCQVQVPGTHRVDIRTSPDIPDPASF